MSANEWTSNAPVIEASEKRLSNGTLGRLRSDEGENVKLQVVEDLAKVFGIRPHELLAEETSEIVAKPGLAASVARIALALEQEMPAEVREDVGDLLEKMAKRKGGTTEQRASLVSLLLAVERPVVVPDQQVGGIDLDHVLSQTPVHHSPIPEPDLGDKSKPGDEWDTRFKSKDGLQPKLGDSSATTTRQTKPKATPRQEKRK